jgi:ribonucleotide reductase class II
MSYSGPQLLSDLVFYRTYSATKQSGFKETYDETVDRAMQMHMDKFPKHTDAIARAFDFVRRKVVMPSMRSLQFAGKPITNENLRQFNCFSRDTEFITNEGIKSFYDFQDGDEVTVLSRKRQWKKATVRKFGKERLYELKVGYGRSGIKIIKTTANHRWPVVMPDKGGGTTEIVLTKDLVHGQKLSKNKVQTYIGNYCKIGLMHGIVFGDGTKQTTDPECFSEPTCIKLCDESVELSKHFFAGRHCSEIVEKGMPRPDRYTVHELPANWKKLPDDMNRRYILGFLMGWFAADGYVTKSGQVMLHSHKLSNLEWAADQLQMMGIQTSSIRKTRDTNPYNGEPADLWVLPFHNDGYLTSEFFVRTKHLDRFHKVEEKHEWRVVSVTETDVEEDVWCVQESETETFTLKNGLLTMNCSFLGMDSWKSFADLFYILCCGCGVGYSVQSHWLRHLPPVQKGSPGYFVVPDTREGWADSYLELFQNPEMEFVYGFIRPAGSVLSSGGTASGPWALKEAHEKIRNILRRAMGRRLRAIEAHDIACHIADSVVVGGTRRCLPYDSKIHTRRGLIDIKDVVVGDSVQTSKGYSDVSAVFDQGVQKTLLIHTDAGTLECTGNHKVAVINGYQSYEWKMAKDLSSEDRLVFNNLPLHAIPSRFPEEIYEVSSYATTLKNIILPELSEEISWFIGYFQGNGHVAIRTDNDNKKHGIVSVSVPSNAPDRLERAVSCLKQFGVNVTISETNGNWMVAKVVSMRLATYFLEHVKKPKVSMVVPDFISTGSYEQRAAYVAGLFDADGASNNRPVNISSIYPDFLKSIQSVCASLGIPTYIKLSRDASGNWKELFHLCFKSSGRHNLSKIVSRFGTKTLTERKSTRCSYSYKSSDVKWKKYPKHIRISVDALNIDAQPFVPVKVLSIEEGREVSTFDIEVKDVHEFYAEGFLVHNSACISMFDPEDEEMRLSKSGKWWEKNPQRARANNSAVIHRKDPDFKSKYFDVMMAMFESKAGEPGILLTNDNDYGKNPCQPANAFLLTPEGIKKLGDVNIGDTIWSGKRWTKVVNKWSTGVKPVSLYMTRYGSFLGTSNHRVVENGVKVEAKDATAIDVCTGPAPESLEDYTSGSFEQDRGLIDFDRMTFTLPIEERQKYLRRFFDHNGSITNNGNTISLMCHSAFGVWLQMLLSSMGVRSTISDIKKNAKGKHRVVITHDKDIFLKLIGKEALADYCVPDDENPLVPFTSSPILEVVDKGEHEVFDLTVDDPEHTYWTGGLLVSNCGEVSLRAVCNLTEVNAPACANKFEFLQAVNAAAFIGKLQSTYTNFGYVQDRFKRWAEEERLLGISITGQADAWRLIGDADVLRSGAAEALRTDEEWSYILGMGLSHRLTTTKPSGSASLLLGSALIGAVSSGIHASHAAFYIRSVRLDKVDPVARYLINVFGLGEPCSNSIIEQDAMSPNLIVVRVPVNSSGSLLRGNETAIQLMNRAKHVFNNWIKPAHREGPNCHNVSLTVNYKEHEKGQIMDWMLENVDCYDGISFLPYSDSTYVQMPFEEITMLDYADWRDKFVGKEIDFSKINFANTVDKRYGEAACSGGQCTITSL